MKKKILSILTVSIMTVGLVGALPAGAEYYDISTGDIGYKDQAYNYPTTSISSTTYALSRVTNLKLKKSGIRTVKISWKRVAGAKGYQVKWSTNKSFVSAKKMVVKKKGTTLENLYKNKYYVKVRAYKLVGGRRVYGKYSEALKLVRI